MNIENLSENRMIKQLKFIILSSDQPTTATLLQLIKKVFPKDLTFSADNGLEGWEFLQKYGTPAVVIADLTMPELSGMQLLKNIRSDKKTKDTFFIIMTNNNEKDQRLKALQQGADGLLSRPLSIDEIICSLRTASNLNGMKTKLVKVQSEVAGLKKQISEDVKLMRGIVETMIKSRFPDMSKKMERIIKASIWIARQLGDVSDQAMVDIGNAAALCYAGRLYLNDNNLDKPIMKKGLVANEKMGQVPLNAFELISKVRNYQEPAKIVKHIYENFDGTGIPEKVQGWQIPVGSRILRVILDFEESYEQFKGNQLKAMDTISSEMNRLYDFVIVAYYDQYLGTFGDFKAKESNESSLKPHELTSGQTLTRNIIGKSGLILLARGQKVEDEQLEKIHAASKAEGIIGNVFVQKA